MVPLCTSLPCEAAMCCCEGEVRLDPRRRHLGQEDPRYIERVLLLAAGVSQGNKHKEDLH